MKLGRPHNNKWEYVVREIKEFVAGKAWSIKTKDYILFTTFEPEIGNTLKRGDKFIITDMTIRKHFWENKYGKKVYGNNNIINEIDLVQHDAFSDIKPIVFDKPECQKFEVKEDEFDLEIKKVLEE